MAQIKLKDLLRQRGYFSIKDEVKKVALIQEVFAELFPFENLDVLLKVEDPITPGFVIQKMLEGGRGGVCYELNALLNVVLEELGFTVKLTSATVWSPEDGWIIDRTHSVNLWEHKGTLYLIDAGSGNNLTCQPVPLDGPPVISPAGTYRLRTKETERGSITLESKVGEEWKMRYSFHLNEVGWEDFNRVKEMIHHHPESPFNQTLLVAQTLPDGVISVNEERLRRVWKSGKEQRVNFASNEEMLQALRAHFHPSIHEAASRYVENKQNSRVK